MRSPGGSLGAVMQTQDAALDRVFQALADPTRRIMVERLSRGPASVTELAAPFAMSLPAVFQHLQVLEQSGLISSDKVGRVRSCEVRAEVLGTGEKWIGDRRALWERRLDRLGAFLAETDPRNQPTNATKKKRTRRSQP